VPWAMLAAPGAGARGSVCPGSVGEPGVVVREERGRLKEALEFHSSMAVVSRGDFEVLKRGVDMAWEDVTRARSAWEAHVWEHACP
jgi:hypothetical protein